MKPLQNSLPHSSTDRIKRFLAIFLQLTILFGLCVGVLSPQQSAQALSGITVTLVTPYVTNDSNDSCSAGPRAQYIQIRVTNNSGAPVNNLSATLNFPTSTPGGSWTGSWLLDQGAVANENPVRFIGTLNKRCIRQSVLLYQLSLRSRWRPSDGNHEEFFLAGHQWRWSKSTGNEHDPDHAL